jgi:DegV family protein with EDD domain
MSVKIIADSTCDLPPEIIKQLEIEVIPLYVNMGDYSLLDGVDVTPKQVIDWSDHFKTTPKTAAPNNRVFQDIFARYLAQGNEVVCITIGSGFSATYQTAVRAAQELGEAPVFVVDSMNLSSGGGHLVMLAAEWAQQGLAAAEIVARVEALRPKVRTSFVVDNLTFLHRGGRCSAIAAFSANALQLKPQIYVQDGKMEVGRKFRGSTRKVVQAYCEAVLKDIETIDPRRVFVTVSPAGPALAETALAIVRGKNYFEEVILTQAGAVITSHCGPNTLGVLFLER